MQNCGWDCPCKIWRQILLSFSKILRRHGLFKTCHTKQMQCQIERRWRYNWVFWLFTTRFDWVQCYPEKSVQTPTVWGQNYGSKCSEKRWSDRTYMATAQKTWQQRKKDTLKSEDFSWWKLIHKSDVGDVKSRNGKVHLVFIHLCTCCCGLRLWLKACISCARIYPCSFAMACVYAFAVLIYALYVKLQVSARI